MLLFSRRLGFGLRADLLALSREDGNIVYIGVI